MAPHDVGLRVSNELPLGDSLLDIQVRRDGRRMGILRVTEHGLTWAPATRRSASSVSWDDFSDLVKPFATGTAAKGSASAGRSASRSRDSGTTTRGSVGAAGKRTMSRTRAAARATASTNASTTNPDAKLVRAWAAVNGITVAPRGKLATSVIEQYRAAQG